MTIVDDIIIACESEHVATELTKSIGESIELKTVVGSRGTKQEFQDGFTLKDLAHQI